MSGAWRKTAKVEADTITTTPVRQLAAAITDKEIVVERIVKRKDCKKLTALLGR